MAKETKYDAILDYKMDLLKIQNAITHNTATKQDYHKLKEYLMLIGFDESDIDCIYIDCGFENSIDFHNQRQRKNNVRGNISCTLSKIRGICEAVVDFLNIELSKVKRDC